MAAQWELLRALFEGAIARDPRERAAFLDEHAKDDPRLRQEVESLLAAHDAAGGFLSGPALGPAPEPSLDPGAPAAGLSVGPGSSDPGCRLAPGTTLGAFSIVDVLGTGGMGQVYRARDTRLDRFVAIKVLPAGDNVTPRARDRFEREARAISRLSHPRICTVHDIGVENVGGRELPYLVMELLDGETLASRLARGPLPVDQAVSCGIDIADALVAAHAQGVVHRDLKPANVMLTTAGVKLLDFGLAQLRESDDAESLAPVRSMSALTSTGLVFGTVPYMSPEQLRGEKVDARTDIFAFGALLHEMLTGVRPFAADSQADLIAAILEREPPSVSERQPLASASLDRIVRKCLAKNPDDRWQTARDLKSELMWLREGREESLRPRSARTQPRSRQWRQAIAIGIPTVAALILAAMIWRRTPARVVTPLSLNLPAGVTLFIPVNGTSIAMAPDGSRIAYIGSRRGVTSLFIHTLTTGVPLDVPDTREAVAPMFSPDSQWVAFGHEGSIKKVPAGGGPVQVIGPGLSQGTMVWLADGRIVRGSASANGMGIAELLPKQQPVTTVADGEEGHLTPLALPGGPLLFTGLRGGLLSTANSINVWRTGATEAARVVANASSPQLVGTDALAFAQGRSLFAAGFDRRSIRLTTEARAMGIQVQTTGWSAAPMYAVADNGTLVYAPWPGGRRLVWIDRNGREEYVKAEERMYAGLRLSPDGTRVAANLMDDDRDLWVIALDGSFAQKLTSGPERDTMPVWSPAGTEIFFTTADRIIMRVPADGATAPQTIFRLPKPDRLHPLSITPDAKRLVMQWDILPKRKDLRILTLDGTPQLTGLVGESGTEGNGQLSRDGKWLVYESAESTEGSRLGQIMVRPFPDTKGFRRIVSTDVGRHPIWSHDGREIFYLLEDGTVMSVPIKTTATPPYLIPGTPVRVVSPVNTLPVYWDVSPDSRRFLLIKAPELDIRSLTVVLNWDVAVKAAIAGERR